jgi:hypothetical protein
MAEPAEPRPVEYRRLFPWLHLARAFRMAVDPRKLLLAGLALVAINAMDAGWNAVRPHEVEATEDRERLAPAVVIAEYVDRVEAAARPDVPVVVVTADDQTFRDRIDARGYLIESRIWPWTGMEQLTDSGRARLALVAGDPLLLWNHVWNVAWAGGTALLLEPLMTIARPLALLFQPVGFLDKAYLVVRLLWALVVWAVVGGAITRMVALEFARDERLGTIAAMRYACGRFFSFLFAPLIAVICVAVIVLFSFLGGLIGAIPYIGPLFAGVLWFLPLLAGFVIVLILVGAALGWPLMYATISVQDSDAFDGFSRSYTFVYGRPWYLALLTCVTVLLSVAGFGVVYVFTAGTDVASQAAVATGMGRENVDDLVGRPRLETQEEARVREESSANPGAPRPRVREIPNSGTWAGTFWRRLVLLLAAGFGTSFFWVAATVSYFLLRRADDGTALDEVEVQYDTVADPLAPLAGVGPADTTPPQTERPIVVLSTEPPRAETMPLAEDEPGEPGGDDVRPGDGPSTIG